jgi:short subunit dehydrogenase-like uncharacterized protein
LEEDPTGATYDKDFGAWIAPFPMSVIDTRVVRRSCSLIGIDVAFQEFTMVSGAFAPLRAMAIAGGSTLLSRAMKHAFFRDMARKSAQSGTGPSIEVMDNGWFRCRILGRGSDGRTAEVMIAGKGDPANRITVKCVCESALAISCDSDKLPARAGILTPSTGVGKTLIRRLREHQITFKLNSSN